MAKSKNRQFLARYFHISNSCFLPTSPFRQSTLPISPYTLCLYRRIAKFPSQNPHITISQIFLPNIAISPLCIFFFQIAISPILSTNIPILALYPCSHIANCLSKNHHIDTVFFNPYRRIFVPKIPTSRYRQFSSQLSLYRNRLVSEHPTSYHLFCLHSPIKCIIL